MGLDQAEMKAGEPRRRSIGPIAGRGLLRSIIRVGGREEASTSGQGTTDQMLAKKWMTFKRNRGRMNPEEHDMGFNLTFEGETERQLVELSAAAGMPVDKYVERLLMQELEIDSMSHDSTPREST